MNHGLQNALKMIEMFTTETWQFNNTPKYKCELRVNDGNANPVLHVLPIHPNGFVERAIATYIFNPDGTYYKQAHT